MSDDANNTVELAAELTMAWLSNANNRASVDEAPAFLKSMYQAVLELNAAPADVPRENTSPEYAPAVTARKSLASPEFIISMIDGKPYKTLTRHLTRHGLTPAEYRSRYGLKADYPMTAPAYSDARRAMAKRIGLGRKKGNTTSIEAAGLPTTSPKRGRPAKVADAIK